MSLELKPRRLPNMPSSFAIAAAIAFFFTGTDDGGITFKSCCDVLRAREDVLRLRIQRGQSELLELSVTLRDAAKATPTAHHAERTMDVPR
jgi:hypothetical protein